LREAGLPQLVLFLFAQVPRQERDAPTVEDGETFGLRGRAGQETTAVNIFEGRQNLLWVKDLKQLITYCKSNISSMKLIGYIVNANLIVILGDMDKDRATPDRPDNPLSKCRHASNDLHGSGLPTLPEPAFEAPGSGRAWLGGPTDARENLKKLRHQLGLHNN